MMASGDMSTLLPALFTFRREKIEDRGGRKEEKRTLAACLRVKKTTLPVSAGHPRRGMVLTPDIFKWRNRENWEF